MPGGLSLITGRIVNFCVCIFPFPYKCVYVCDGCFIGAFQDVFRLVGVCDDLSDVVCVYVVAKLCWKW